MDPVLLSPSRNPTHQGQALGPPHLLGQASVLDSRMRQNLRGIDQGQSLWFKKDPKIFLEIVRWDCSQLRLLLSKPRWKRIQRNISFLGLYPEHMENKGILPLLDRKGWDAVQRVVRNSLAFWLRLVLSAWMPQLLYTEVKKWRKNLLVFVMSIVSYDAIINYLWRTFSIPYSSENWCYRITAAFTTSIRMSSECCDALKRKTCKVHRQTQMKRSPQAWTLVNLWSTIRLGVTRNTERTEPSSSREGVIGTVITFSPINYVDFELIPQLIQSLFRTSELLIFVIPLFIWHNYLCLLVLVR